MKKYLVAALFSAVSVTSVQAIENQKTVCTHGGKTRVIEVVYTTEENLPCEVRYSKEEGSQTPWSALNLAGYCEEKAAALVEKQTGWGWSCKISLNTAAINEAPMTETEPAEMESTEMESAEMESTETEPTESEAMESVDSVNAVEE
jgi:hypothetical protein